MKREPVTLDDLNFLAYRIAKAEGWGWTKEEAELADADAHAEQYAESAWLRYAERSDPESEADLALHDFLHPNGYGR